MRTRHALRTLLSHGVWAPRLCSQRLERPRSLRTLCSVSADSQLISRRSAVALAQADASCELPETVDMVVPEKGWREGQEVHATLPGGHEVELSAPECKGGLVTFTL